MNKQIFNKLMKEGGPYQEPTEWRLFLEFCSWYLKDHRIKNPIVVELGAARNRQKKFYEQLLKATHVGVDKSKDRSIPDILGDTHDSRTLNALKVKLKGKPINILFIDAAHGHEDVKKDFEMYAPLCSDLVVLHDIETFRNSTRRKSAQVWKFWDELMLDLRKREGLEDYRECSILTIVHRRTKGWQKGIGIIMKK